MNRGALSGEMGDNLSTVALTFGDAGGDISNVFAGRYHTCVSGTDGGLACFGINNGGQLGAETEESALGDEPEEVESIPSIDLGSGVVVAAVPAPGADIPLITDSPVPAPTPPSAGLSPTPVPTILSVSIG